MADKKIMMVLPPRDFDGRSFETLRRVLAGRGHRVSVTSVAQGTATSDEGTTVPVDVGIKDVKSYDYDAFIFVGGDGARIYFEDERVRALAKDVKYKTVASTGSAAVILAFSEVLKGKKATCPYEWAGLVIGQGASYTNRPLEVDEKVITLQDATLAEHLANAVAKAVE